MSQKVEVQMIEKSEREGCLYYKVTHNRKSCLIETGHIIDVSEWDEENGSVKVGADNTYASWLKACLIRKSLQAGLQILEQIIEDLRKRGRFTSGDIVEKFKYSIQTLSCFHFMETVITQLKISGRTRTAETYMSAYKRFRLFVGIPDITFNEMDSELIEMYEDYLKKSHISLNTISFYMRIMRAVYNRAVEAGLVLQHYPFRKVYTGVEKTVKRAIPFTFIKSIKELKLKEQSALGMARDMFLFSFYTRGMSFVDMAYLKTADIKNGNLVYRRRKTGQQLFVRWENCMQEIVDKYVPYSDYLLPIIRKEGNERTQYTNALHLVNNRLKQISSMIGLDIPLSMYVARHSWASMARDCHVPMAVISEGLGHHSENTTRIYLSSLDHSMIDNANMMILSKLL